ncbi:hypothetical protein [Nocardioides acrostichi]|uniref:Uncharacterized protein n=1 Tax=Nocardioides acrostichi TaxID=2784339 RepID=A0A930V1U9_9ACTN|nr:hypothetical protein [Nocardioides acrostichi]MBF4162346.1 hypothetical protein [Nocardioides acrostichi]
MRITSTLVSLTTVTLVAVLAGGGGAVAGSLITGKQIKDGSVTGVDIKDGSLGVKDMAATTRKKLRGPRGPAGLVRAYGAHYTADEAVHTQSGGITSTSYPSEGIVCLHVPGLTPAASVMTVDLVWEGDRTFGTSQSFIEVRAEHQELCRSGDFVVYTFWRDFGSGQNASLHPDDMAFTFQIS